jgi:5-methylcytosine-specific restriction endonuclease McrA
MRNHGYGLVSETRLKPPNVKLDRQAYRKLHRQILKRDGWRCQMCGSMQRLHVQHLEFRSHSGADSEENLITLCSECHAQLHSF